MLCPSRKSWLALAAGLSFSLSLVAQTFTSSITGVVTDPTGAVISGASVRLLNEGNNNEHDFTSSNDGSYQFNNLEPGSYSVTVNAPGFKTSVRSHLVLQAQIASTVNVGLQLGGSEQKVEVTSSAVLVDTQTANNVTTLDSRLIAALPNNTRNPLNFVFALAGTTEAPGGQTQRNGSLDQMSSNFGLNGGRTGNEQILIDGAPSQAVDWGGLLVSPLQDSIQEQQVVVNTYDSQYERAGGGVVTLITKSGTNRFHGEAYDYLQNSALQANSWYNNTNGYPKGQFKQNQFGGNFGGPLLKRANLYFFGGYEGLRQPNTQSTGQLTVPTVAERNGDFSHSFNSDGSLDIIYNPFTSMPVTDASGNTTYTRQPFPNNMIPASLFDPVGKKIANLYPLPNQPGQGANGIYNYYKQGTALTVNDKFDTRVDWEQSSKNRMFVRYSERVRQNQTIGCFFCNGADQGNNQGNTGFQAVLNDTFTPSANWVVNAFVSYSRWRESHTAVGYGQATASAIGLDPSLFQAPLLPTIGADNQFTYLGNGSYQKYVRYSSTSQVNITRQWGKQTWKFGANFDVGMINSVNENVGSFNFSSALTSCDPNPGAPCMANQYSSTQSGSSIASMLLGTGSGGGTGTNIDPAMSLHTYGVYFQDQWRVNSRLTINAGLRYENQRPATERFNRLEFFDPNVVNPISSSIGFTVKGGFEYADKNNRYAWQPDNLNFAPRLGIAYKITDRLVARAGAGIFYLQPSAMLTFDNPGQFYGFSSSTGYNATDGITPLNLVSNPFPGGLNSPQGGSQGLSTLVGDGLGQIWPKAPHPIGYTEQWSFNLQYQLSSHAVIEAGYTGNRGRKLLYGNPNLDADQLPDQYLSLGNHLNDYVANPFYGHANPNTYLDTAPMIQYNELLRPYPEFTYLQYTRSLPGASSSFNALNVKFNQAFSNGLSLLVTYQWSKALDNGPEDFFGWATGSVWRDSYNTRLDYAISTHDVPQSFATALVYDLPYGKGKTWGSDAPKLVRQVLGNWQVSTVTRLASGLPLGTVVVNPNNPLGNYGYPGPYVPDLVGNPKPSNQTPQNWINASAFQAPATNYQLGTSALRLTELRERPARNVDIALGKSFGITEAIKTEFRGEFLNAFNYAQYNSVCTDLSQTNCPVFGAVQNTENAPRTIQLSLKVTF